MKIPMTATATAGAGAVAPPQSRALLARVRRTRARAGRGPRPSRCSNGCKLCTFFSSNLDDFFMVRVAGLLSRRRPGRRRSPDGRTPDAGARRDPRARARADRAPVPAMEARAPARARRGRDHRRRRSRTSTRRRCSSSSGSSTRIFPGADAARRRARPAVPVHLRALAEPRRLRTRPRYGRRALRTRQGAGAAPAVPAGRRPAAASSRSSRSSATSFRGCSRRWRSSSARSSASRATPTSRSTTTPPTCSRPSRRVAPAALRRASSGSRSSRAISTRMLTVLKHGLTCRRSGLPRRGAHGPRRPRRARGAPTPRPEGRAVAGERAGAPRAARDAESIFDRSSAATCSSTTRTTRSPAASRPSCGRPRRTATWPR